jgi:hypothetical protein
MWVYATNFQLCRSGGSSRTKDSSGMWWVWLDKLDTFNMLHEPIFLSVFI